MKREADIKGKTQMMKDESIDEWLMSRNNKM